MDYDMIVIGGGSGGLAAAKTAADLGARVALIEADKLGGTCVNRGCVPKKLIWYAAEAVERAGRLTASGALTGGLQVDLARHKRLRDAHIAELHATFERQLDDGGIDLIRDRARIVAEGRVTVGGRTMQAGRVLLATGAAPVRPDIPGIDLAEVSDDVFTWTEPPARLLIVGGGYIGCEFAAMFAAFGTRVVLVSDGDRVLEEFSPAVSEIAGQNLSAQGVELRLGTRPERIDRDGEGFTVAMDTGPAVQADRVLMAIGRAPQTDALGPLEDAAETASSGALCVDGTFATTAPGVYAIGDCADRLPLTPVAVADGQTVSRQLFGEGAEPVSLDHVTTAAFVLPPAAEVGGSAPAQSGDYDPLLAAIAQGAPKGYWGLSRTDAGTLCGVYLVGEGSHETIAWAGQLQLCGPTHAQMQRSLAIHPSDAEEPLR